MARGRVLVVHPPTTVARDFIDYPYFADLGAVQLAAVLMRSHQTTLVDAYALPSSTLAWRSDGRAHLGAPVGEVLDAIASYSPFDAAVVAYTPFHRPPARDDVLAAVLLGLRAVAGDRPVILADCHQSGQHYVEAPAASILAAYPEVDALVKYEAEVTVPALVDAWIARGERPAGAHRGAEVPALDDLPPPAWDLVDLAAHDRFRARVVAHLGRGAWAFPVDGRTLPVVTSRGCPFTCAHCSSNPGRPDGAPKTQRRLSAGALAARLATLVQVHKTTRLEVLDEMLNVSARHFDAFLDTVEKLGVKWDAPNGLRADYLEPRHFVQMHQKVTTASVSAESGVQRVVDEVVGKRLDLAAIERAAAAAHEAGVPLLVHFMIGLPGERAEEVNATLAYAMDLHDRFGVEPSVQFATPLPGTALARGRSLLVVDDWGPRFQGAPSQPDAAVRADALQRFKWTFDERLKASRGPQKLVMNVTYVCNNHCTFCAVGTRTQLHGFAPRQREHLDRYAAMGVRQVDFDGGEPTLHPELLDLVRHARARGFERVNVTTNGRLAAYDDFARALVRSGVTTLLVSLHGPDAATHAAQVGVAEAFDQTLAGLCNCIKFAPPGVEIGVNVTITKGNVDKLDALVALVFSVGVRWVNLQFLTPFGRATRMLAPDTADAARKVDALIDAWCDRIKFQVINLPFCFLPGKERFLVGDLGKLERHMVFVNNDDVNLAAYLAERRVRKAECAPCPHAIFCGGFYELDKVPEPPWIVRAEDLVRQLPPVAKDTLPTAKR